MAQLVVPCGCVTGKSRLGPENNRHRIRTIEELQKIAQLFHDPVFEDPQNKQTENEMEVSKQGQSAAARNFNQEILVLSIPEEFETIKTDLPEIALDLETETDYIKNEVFGQLLPALEETLNKAKIWEAFTSPKCFFNGIDHIVQVLWNHNPRHPSRLRNNLHLFNMPWVRQYLKEHPRPYYPKSWLWTEAYAATLIQKTVRQYFVQREEEVQEMRDFWRKLKVEHSHPDMDMNPMYSKKFASSMKFK